MNVIKYWKFDNNDQIAKAQLMREKIAVEFEKKEISNPKTFEEAKTDYAVSTLDFLNSVISGGIRGRVLEVGSGCGIYSSHIASYKNVEIVYGLEYSEKTVTELATSVLKKFSYSEEVENKVQFIVGSFDEIHFEDESIDFIIDVGSLHHSTDRLRTFKELYRVLKTDGYLLAVERASTNNLNNHQLNSKLDIEYDSKFKISRGFDINEKLTRRMNSEHDPLMAEWEYLLTKVGFDTKVFWIFKPMKGNRGFRLIWNVLGRMIFNIVGKRLFKKNICQFSHLKIPFYPFFTKQNPNFNIIIIAKKIPFIEMP